MEVKECPKCGGRMETGFVRDLKGACVFQSEWMKGQPERSFWGGVKFREKESLPVQTYRCSQCGFLESYADKKID